MTTQDAMINKKLLPKYTLIAYHKGDKYCERLSSARTDMHNAINVRQKQYTNCHDYHNNTNICQKMQEPQCKYAVRFYKNCSTKTWNFSRYRKRTDH